MAQANIFNPPVPKASGEKLNWSGLNGSSIGLAIASAISHHQQPILIIAPDSLTVSRLCDEIAFFTNNTDELLHFPDWETLPYDHFSPHHDIISERLSCLSRLPSLTRGGIIVSIDTLLHVLPPVNFIDGHIFALRIKDRINIDIMRTRLTHAGYRSVSQVREHGEFTVRGSIIDIFPMGSQLPFRIDLFDDEIDSIRLFSPETQRTTEQVDEIQLLPAKEFPFTAEAIETFRQAWRERFTGSPSKCPTYHDVSESICPPGIEYYLPLFFASTSHFFDYLPKNTLIVSIGNLNEKSAEFWREINARYEQGRHDILNPLLPPQELFIPGDQFNAIIKAYPRIIIDSHQHDVLFQTELPPNLNIDHKASEPLAALKTFIENDSGRVLFCAESTGRREVLLTLFRSIHLDPAYFHSFRDFIDSDAQYGIVVAPIEEGFQLAEPDLTLISESQLYNQRVMQRRLRKKSQIDPDALIRDLTELNINDPVVHIEHGIGRYCGLQTLTVGEQIAEYLCLEYQNNDKLFVPVSSLHYISRYTGANPENIPINKLGTDQWLKSKRRAAQKVRDVAAELLDLYAKRAAKPGDRYEYPKESYDKFASEFPFEETPDQLQAIGQVVTDLLSDKPMDRVICGDVGFGKTEVAMRAAFLAVQNNKQVAVLVPTTLLAQQHYRNFLDRFADWPIKIEVLSRFRTTKEQNSVLIGMQEGKVDIVIGTHKLIQSDVKFKSLGLIIIDEEHRFGVKQKERFKALRSQVDMLTLTATPIPRTLNMALSGIRDLSIIATPPARRLSVKTFVSTYQNNVIIEAIQREIMRGGQVYFLHNDISTINKKAEEITTLVKEARASVAHGQMHERELEKVMSEFYHRHSNVLVCSTIIESGIDVPSANTIIINRADKFGIAQLHQLRGRVGRSHHQAYAYLMIPDRKSISNDAIKRLDAISAYDDLGIGFTLSTHDLEIRGAGELLGEEQSGDMQEIGFTLYMDLLSRAVDALKNGTPFDDEKSLLFKKLDVDLHVTALIPESYLPDIQLRLQFYKMIASAKSSAALDEIHVNMIDRFGLTPESLKSLFQITDLKLKADTLGIVKIEANELGGKIDFSDTPNINPEQIIRLLQDKSGRFRLEGPRRLRFTLAQHEPKDRVTLMLALLKELSQ